MWIAISSVHMLLKILKKTNLAFDFYIDLKYLFYGQISFEVLVLGTPTCKLFKTSFFFGGGGGGVSEYSIWQKNEL